MAKGEAAAMRGKRREPGCYFPAPRCLRSATFRKYFNDSSPCVAVGKVSCGAGAWADADDEVDPSVSTRRSRLMLSNAALSFIALILQFFVLASFGLNNSTIRTTPWTIASGGFSNGTLSVAIDAFFGLRASVFDYSVDGAIVSSGTITYRWLDANCSEISYLSNYSRACNECGDASVGVWSTVFASAVTGIAQLQTDLSRSTRRGDTNCQKFMGIFTGILGFITTGAALLRYSSGCRNNLPRTLSIYAAKLNATISFSVVYARGVSFFALAAATLLKPINVTFHVIVPSAYLDGHAEDEDNCNL